MSEFFANESLKFQVTPSYASKWLSLGPRLGPRGALGAKAPSTGRNAILEDTALEALKIAEF